MKKNIKYNKMILSLATLGFLLISCNKDNNYLDPYYNDSYYDDPYYNDSYYDNPYRNRNNINNRSYSHNRRNSLLNRNQNGLFVEGEALNQNMALRLQAYVRGEHVEAQGKLRLEHSSCGLERGIYTLSTIAPGYINSIGSGKNIVLGTNQSHNGHHNRITIVLKTLQGNLVTGYGFYTHMTINGCSYLLTSDVTVQKNSSKLLKFH